MTPRLPDTFSVSYYYDYTDADPDAGLDTDSAKSFVFVADGGLTFVIDVPRLEWNPLDYDWEPGQDAYFVSRAPVLGGAVTALAAQGTAAYLADDHGVWRYVWDAGVGSSERLAFPGFGPAQLRSIRGDTATGTPPLVLAFDDTRMAWLDPVSDRATGVLQLPGVGASAILYDVAEARYYSNGPQYLFASTSVGLYFARRDATGFLGGANPAEPTWFALDLPQLPHLACDGGSTGRQAMRISANAVNTLRIAAELVPASGGGGGPEVLVVQTNDTPPVLAECGAAAFSQVGSIAPACEPGGRLVDLNVGSAWAWSECPAATRCRYTGTDGGETERSYELKESGGGSALIPSVDWPYGSPLETRATPSLGSKERLRYADEFGRFWFGSEGGGERRPLARRRGGAPARRADGRLGRWTGGPGRLPGRARLLAALAGAHRAGAEASRRPGSAVRQCLRPGLRLDERRALPPRERGRRRRGRLGEGGARLGGPGRPGDRHGRSPPLPDRARALLLQLEGRHREAGRRRLPVASPATSVAGIPGGGHRQERSRLQRAGGVAVHPEAAHAGAAAASSFRAVLGQSGSRIPRRPAAAVASGRRRPVASSRGSGRGQRAVFAVEGDDSNTRPFSTATAVGGDGCGRLDDDARSFEENRAAAAPTSGAGVVVVAVAAARPAR